MPRFVGGALAATGCLRRWASLRSAPTYELQMTHNRRLGYGACDEAQHDIATTLQFLAAKAPPTSDYCLRKAPSDREPERGLTLKAA